DPSRPTLDQAEAVRGFLAALGVPVTRVSASLPAQAGLHRTLLTGKQALVVLRNARAAEQGRPLLPGAPGCLATLTSRPPPRHRGPDISASAAASLAGIARDQARSLLAELARAHLLTEHVPGRYACHDLLRAYAAEWAYSGEDDNARRAAIDRMHDHYLRTAE